MVINASHLQWSGEKKAGKQLSSASDQRALFGLGGLDTSISCSPLMIP